MKTVLLFSGGFDSMLQEYVLRPDVLLYVDMHTTYSEVEKEFLKTLPKRYQERLVIKDLPIGEFEGENMYLPYRNLLLAGIALQYGQRVCFGFNKGDNASDKDSLFIKSANLAYSVASRHMGEFKGWDSDEISIEAPFQYLTKTQMVHYARLSGMGVKTIQNIRSCYHPTSKQGCGVCTPCIAKAVALINNDIFVNNFDSPITPEVLAQSIKQHYEDKPVDWVEDYEKAYDKVSGRS